MNEDRTQSHKTCRQLLSLQEQQEFDLIIASARCSGWIAVDQEMAAELSGPWVVVRSHPIPEIETNYCHGQRWLFELLHDLAHGAWKQRLD